MRRPVRWKNLRERTRSGTGRHQAGNKLLASGGRTMPSADLLIKHINRQRMNRPDLSKLLLDTSLHFYMLQNCHNLWLKSMLA